MSFKEFVPTARFGASYSHDDETVSSSTTMNYSMGSFDQSPYWSPTSETETRNIERNYSSYDNIAEIEDTSIGSQNGMNLSAASWIPPTIAATPSTGPLRDQTAGQDENKAYEGFRHTQQHDDDDDYIEPLVEISWNEQSYVVPESTAYVYDEGMGYPHSLEVRECFSLPFPLSLPIISVALTFFVYAIPSSIRRMSVLSGPVTVDPLFTLRRRI